MPLPTDGGDSGAWGAILNAFLTDLETRVVSLEATEVNSQSGTDYTLAVTDISKIVEMTSASDAVVRVPWDFDDLFGDGSIEIYQYGAGEVRVDTGSILPLLLDSDPRVAFLMHEASGQLQDESGNNLDTFAGTGTAVYGVPGVPGNPPDSAISFTGTQEFHVSDNALLDLGDSFALEAVIKRNSATAANQGIISKGANAYYMRLKNDHKINLLKSGATDISSSTATITDTTDFHHVMVEKSGATVAIYVDGAEGHSAPAAATCADNAAGLYIGAQGSGPSEPADLVIAGAVAYPAPLGATKAAEHAEAWLNGITIHNADDFRTLRAQHSSVILRRRAANEWVLQGDLKA